MRVACGVVVCFSIPLAFGRQAVGSAPSAMEAFAKRQGVRTVWSSEIAQWKDDSTDLVITALLLEDNTPSPRKLRGVRFDLSNGKAKDQIYLDEQATERTRSALEEIATAVAPSGVPGGNGCMGAAEFWPSYDWPWNKYHELNVDFCGDSRNLALVLYGRGKRGSFRFPNKYPADLARILVSAMEQIETALTVSCGAASGELVSALRFLKIANITSPFVAARGGRQSNSPRWWMN